MPCDDSLSIRFPHSLNNPGLQTSSTSSTAPDHAGSDHSAAGKRAVRAPSARRTSCIVADQRRRPPPIRRSGRALVPASCGRRTPRRCLPAVEIVRDHDDAVLVVVIAQLHAADAKLLPRLRSNSARPGVAGSTGPASGKRASICSSANPRAWTCCFSIQTAYVCPLTIDRSLKRRSPGSPIAST